MEASCIFCKIIQKTIPSRMVYEDDLIYAFHDIAPWAPIHFLIVPKLHLVSMAHVQPEHQTLLGHIMIKAPQLALEQGCHPYPDGGFRLLCNTGKVGRQEVHHLHWHVMGGDRPWKKG